MGQFLTWATILVVDGVVVAVVVVVVVMHSKNICKDDLCMLERMPQIAAFTEDIVYNTIPHRNVIFDDSLHFLYQQQN